MGEQLPKDLIISLSVGKGLGERVYSIGPYGRRVNFAFQQRRALYLANHIVDKHGKEKDGSIAVLGAGIAGVTVSLALKRAGFTNIELYEKEDDVLCLQSNAPHRYIHPGYSDWPLHAGANAGDVTNAFSATTNFPLLNWHCGSAQDVVGQIREQWDSEVKSEDAPEDRSAINFIPNREILSVELRNAQNPTGEINVASRPTSRINRIVRPYSVVVLALGFGLERDLDDAPDARTYWDPDCLAPHHSGPTDGENEIVVSGTGDGGLIDFARAAMDYGENGGLPIQLISHLRDEKYRLMPGDFDETSPAYSSIEREIADAEQQYSDISPKNFDRESKDLGSFYIELIKKLKQSDDPAHQAAFKLLSDAVKRADLDRVTFYGKTLMPFLPNTAPINKLIAAFLMHEKEELYGKGKLELRGPTGPRIRHDVNDKQEEEDVDASNLAEGTMLFVRHGAIPPLHAVCKTLSPNLGDENATFFEGLKNQANDLSDFSFDPGLFEQSVVTDMDGLDTPIHAGKDLGDRKVRAQKFVEKFFTGGKLVALKDEDGNPFFNVRVLDKSAYQNTYLPLGGFDRQLFGVPLVFTEVDSDPMGIVTKTGNWNGPKPS